MTAAHIGWQGGDFKAGEIILPHLLLEEAAIRSLKPW
jgi:hypothetical protein